MIARRLFCLLLALAFAAPLAAAPQCGNSLLDNGESCDDGNSSNGDGCSSSCQVESGYECTLPIPPSTDDAIENGGFEAGSTPVGWTEYAYPFSTLVCTASLCVVDPQFGARSGERWVWFGGANLPVNHWLQQDVLIRAGDTTLSFWYKLPGCNANSPADFLNLTIDGNEVFRVAVDSPLNPLCNDLETYRFKTIDLETASGGPYNDNTNHTVRFNAKTFGNSATSFFVDDVTIARGASEPIPSVCSAFDSCLAEDFDPAGSGIPTQWSTFENDTFSVPWGTTDGPACDGTNAGNNFTGGTGEAACINSDGGKKATSSYLCTDPVDLSSATGSRLQFLLNYQVRSSGPEDAFDVLVGTAAPSMGTIGSYSPLFAAGSADHGQAFSTPGVKKVLDLSAFEGASVHICFHYGALGDWYAQVDDVEVRADACSVQNPPDVPSLIAASDGVFTNLVRVDWTDVGTETHYEVYRCNHPSNTSGCQFVGQQPANVATFDDFGADPGGAVHHYRVKACNSFGCSPYSASDAGFRKTVPAAPSSIDASDGTFIDFVRLNWPDVAGEEEYHLYYCTDATDTGSCIQFASRLANVTTFDDTGADPDGGIHYYRVRACNSAGCSGFSPSDPGYRDTVNIPPVPIGVAASDGTFIDFVRVSWIDGPDEDSYQVFRCTAPLTGCFLVQATEPNTNSFDDDTADPDGGVHYYHVRACNADGCSSLSTADSGYRQTAVQPPAAPTGVNASDGAFADRVQVAWSDVAGEDNYHVFRCASPTQTGGCVDIGQTPANDTAFADFGAAADGTEHFYRVRACNPGGCSVYSAADSGHRLTPPPVPIGVSASDGTFSAMVRVTWTDGPLEAYYEIFRCSSPGPADCGDPIGSVPSGNTVFEDTGAAADGTSHFYRVRSCNAAGCSPLSAADAGYRQPPAPDIPGNVAATDGDFVDRVRVTWLDVTLESRYEIHRCDDGVATDSCALLGERTSGTTSYDDFAADEGGGVHYYRLRACNEAGCSGYSAADAGFRGVPPSDRIFKAGFEGAVD